MSCQLPMLSLFQDIEVIKKHLFPNSQSDSSQSQPVTASGSEDVMAWADADWGWQEDMESADRIGQEKSNGPLSWLQQCCVSVSPTADFMAIAHGEKLILLSQKWDQHEKGEIQSKFVILFEERLADQNEVSVHDAISFRSNKVTCATSELITSVLCLPLASQKKSTHGGPDWMCILVGFSSGYVRMYTENGMLLLSQIFSDEPVQQIRCRTYELPRHPADAEKHEELTILYKRALVSIDGFSFFQSLRACRNQVARATAAGSEQIQPPPLAYKKYGLQDQDKISDHIMGGMITPNPFDQMVTGSMIGGYTANIKPTPPASQLYITAGTQPYVSFFHAVEGSAQPMLSDVAHAVASKLKSALFSQFSAASGWLGFGSKGNQDSQKEKRKPKIEPATPLRSRYELRDKRRSGEILCLSPNNKMAATTDSFGRVLLLDLLRGVAVRMWKGYRDAQLGWVEVKEDMQEPPGAPHQSKSQQRHAVFLVIYAPRRGILEVWAAQQGARVAAFNVSKHCVLACPGYGMMGLNNVTCRSNRCQVHQCFLIDPNDGVRTIDVPFHLILSEKNSRRARDMHLFKKLKVALKEAESDNEGLQTEVIGIVNDIRIASIRKQAVLKVLHTKYLGSNFLRAVLQSVCQKLQIQIQECAAEEGATLDYDSRMLEQFCKAHTHLIITYLDLDKFNMNPPVYVQIEQDQLASQHKCLGISDADLQTLKQQLNCYQQALPNQASVRFDVNQTDSVIEFLSCFNCHTSLSETDRVTATCQISVSPGLSEAKRSRLGNFMFRKVLATKMNEDFAHYVNEALIPADDMMELLLHIWLSSTEPKIESAVSMYDLIKIISSLKECSQVSVNHNSVSPWWQKVRDFINESENINAALLVALVGRAVAADIVTDNKAMYMESQMNSSTDSTRMDTSEWESITLDRMQWTITVKQLEDLLELQCLLKMKPACRSPGAVATGELEPISVSVKKVLDGGRGVIPELVGKWIAGNGIPPSMLCLAHEDEDSSMIEEGQEVTEEKKIELQNPIVGRLQVIQKRLPHSLDADTLMASCAWEYILRWKKDPEVTFSIEQAVAYVMCIQNSVVQHGIASMIWHMFVSKKISAAAYLTEKVGKAPKERLCRKDVGMSDVALKKLTYITAELLETLGHVSKSKATLARQESSTAPVLNLEDIWQGVQGPSSLVELTVEQKDTNNQLVQHHHALCLVLHAVLTFKMRSCKPLSLYNAKSKSAFFKPLHSTPTLPSTILEDAAVQLCRQFLCKIIHYAVLSLDERREPMDDKNESALSLSFSASSKGSQYSQWPPIVLKLALHFDVDQDIIRRHHVCELYSSGLDKLAEEVLLTVSDHSAIGSQLLLISGQRLIYYISTSDSEGGVDKIANCPPNVSIWLKTLDPSQLRSLTMPLKDTATLIGHVVNQLSESHSEYHMAISLVELVQSLM